MDELRLLKMTETMNIMMKTVMTRKRGCMVWRVTMAMQYNEVRRRGGT